MERVGSLKAYMLLTLILLSPLMPVIVSSQPQQQALDWSIYQNMLTVDTDNYNVRLNATAGGIVWFALKLGQIQYNLLNNGEILPVPIIDVVREGNQPSSIYRVKGNQTYELDYPGTLSLNPWTVEIVYNDTMKLVARLTPSQEALADISPLTAYAEITFYSWSPIIEYKLVIENPSEEASVIKGRQGGVTIGIVVNDNTTEWRYVVNKDGKVVELDSLDEEWSNITSVALFKRVGDRIAYMVSILPLQEPERVKGTPGFQSGNYTSETTYTLLLDMGQIEIGPGEKKALAFKIAYIPAKPLQLAQTELLETALSLDEMLLEDVRKGFNFIEEIQQLNATVTNLRDRISNLQQTLIEKDKKLQELEGCEDYWKTELDAAQQTIKQLRERLQNAGMLQVIAFIVGLLLGLIGVRYAFR